ncbi:MAG: glycosyltransferase [Thaumarchaeota archaeon]|nr:glycosyltransferase [Nitrososphaerota archaeon]
MSNKDPSEEKNVTQIKLKLNSESTRCKSINDFVDLSYSFHHNEFTISPIQIKTEIQKLLYVLEKTTVKTALEIGTAGGGTLFLLCKVLPLNATIISIDLPGGQYGGELYPEWKSTIYRDFRKKGQDLHLLRMDSHDPNTVTEVKKIVGGMGIDFILIDADHSYEGVKKDFEMYSKLVSDGGIIAFHDINSGTEDHVGGVPRFWSEISSKFPSVEITDDKKANGYGIGLLVLGTKNVSKKYLQIVNMIIDIKDKEIAEAKKNPLGILYQLYSTRKDLQEAYPEFSSGNHDRMIEWACQITNSEIVDSDVELLKPYASWYMQQLERITSIKSLQKEVEQLRSRTDVMSREIEEKETLIDQLWNKIGVMDKKMLENETLVGQLKNKADIMSREIEEKSREIEEKSREIEEKSREIEEKSREIEEKTGQIEREKVSVGILDRELSSTRNELTKVREEMSKIHQSIIYKYMKSITSKIDKGFPDNSKRGQLKEVVRQGLIIIQKEGSRSFFKHVRTKIRKREFKIIFPNKLGESLINYESWFLNQYSNEKIALMEKETSQLELKPKISIIMPVYNVPRIYLEKAIESVIRQIYNNWELCICDDGSTESHIKKTLNEYTTREPRIKIILSPKNEGIVKASNKALSLATGEFIALLDNDDEISPNALLEVVKTLNRRPDTDYIYTDEDKIDEEDHHMEPFFKPDWSPDLFLSMNYVTHLSVIRKDLVDKIGGFHEGFDGSQDYDLVLRVTERTKKIEHIEKILYSWRSIPGSGARSTDAKPYALIAAKKALQEALVRRKIEGRILDGLFLGSYRVKYHLLGNPLVSIIILNKDNAKMLKQCIDSIETKSSYRNYEIIIVDHDSQDPDTIKYLKTIKHKILKYKGEFNFSKMNNIGVKESSGKQLIILNNDTQVIAPDWIESLLEHSQKSEVGIVGAKLLYPDQSVQHAGIIIGFNDYATNYELPRGDVGYFGIANVIRNVSAVTAACFMMKREIFDAVGGFDEEMAQSWQDVDICLKVLELKKLIIYTPYALLFHLTGATRGKVDLSLSEEIAKKIFKKKNLSFIEKGDPYYNHNLSLHGIPYTLNVYDSVTSPLALLLALYNDRKDLQKVMPEAKYGNYNRLLLWAKNSGLTNDSAKPLLERFAEYYRSIEQTRN